MSDIRVRVNLLEKSVTYMSNCLLQIGYRIEGGRGLSGDGYLSRNQEWIERGFRVWLAEQALVSVHFEIFDPHADKAYEVGKVVLDYSTDPRGEEVTKPPIAQLEEVLKKLPPLPPGAKLRVVAFKAAHASVVPGWYPTQLRALIGVPEEVEVGDAYGFGHVWGRIKYVVGRLGKEAAKEEPQTIELS
jgi:hypothetical protein